MGRVVCASSPGDILFNALDAFNDMEKVLAIVPSQRDGFVQDGLPQERIQRSRDDNVDPASQQAF